MIGHDSKRVKEDDESYEEEDGVRRRKDHSLLPDGTTRPREEGPIMQTMIQPQMPQQSFVPL